MKFSGLRALLVLPAALGLAASPVLGGAAVWTTDGPIGPGSPVVPFSIQADRSGDSVVYAAAGAGVFRSSDDGATWEPASRGLDPGLVVLGVDPVQQGTLYVGFAAFHPAGVVTGFGLHKSTDAGATWQQIRADGVDALAIDPTDPRVLYVSARMNRSFGPPFPLGIFRSVDGGAAWTGPGSLASASSLAVDPGQPSVVWATDSASSAGGSVYRSDDRGATWSSVAAAGSAAHFVSFDPFRRSGVWIGTENGLLHAAAGAAGPTLVAGSAGLAVLGIAYDSANPLVLTVATRTGVYQTRDGGAFFSPLSAAPSGSIRTIESRGSTLWVAVDASISRSLDGGSSWEAVDHGLWYTHVKSLISIPGTANGLRVLSATAGNIFDPGAAGSLFERAGPEDPWAVVSTNLADPSQYRGLTQAPGDSRRLYLLGDSPAVFPAFLRSDDGGRTWRQLATPTVPVSLAVSPVDADTLFVGGFLGGATYKSLDGGNSWSLSLEARGFVAPIVFAPSQPSTLYAISTDYNGLANVLRTTDSGSTWIDFGRPQAPGPSVLAVDASNPYLVYVAVPPATIYRSTDGANSWTRAGEPELSVVRTLTADPTRPGRLWAAGEGGVFLTNDRGDTWSTLNTGLTDLSVLSLVLDPSSRTLHAGTATSGVFDLELSPDRAKVTAPVSGRPPSRIVSRP